MDVRLTRSRAGAVATAERVARAGMTAESSTPASARAITTAAAEEVTPRTSTASSRLPASACTATADASTPPSSARRATYASQ